MTEELPQLDARSTYEVESVSLVARKRT